eukprot:IDg13215t1
MSLVARAQACKWRPPRLRVSGALSISLALNFTRRMSVPRPAWRRRQKLSMTTRAAAPLSTSLVLSPAACKSSRGMRQSGARASNRKQA